MTQQTLYIKPTRPILRYHGGKWNLAKWLIPFFPPHRTYVEPYGGAGSVLLQKPRSHMEVYNDLNGDIVNLFRVLRDPVTAAKLKTAIEYTPYAHAEFLAASEAAADAVEQARHTVIRASMGFSTGASNPTRRTGFRSRSTAGTHPAQNWKDWPDQIAAFTNRLQGVVIENRTARTLIPHYDSDDTLFYVDPPYPWETRTSTDAYMYEMDDDDHQELSKALHAMRGMVILSGYPCQLYDEILYPDWRRFSRRHRVDGGRESTEIIWMNDNAVQYCPVLLQKALLDS